MFDVLVIGGGPCGVSASIYLKRAGYSVAIVEKSFIGGQIGLSSELVNYAGFVEKDAFIFCQNLSKQLKDFDIPVIYGAVTSLTKNADKTFVVKTADNEYVSKACVLSIGAETRKLGLLAETKFMGRGISYCSICDGNGYKDKVVAVVGGGNSAFEDAIYLSKICSKVYLINRSERFRAEDYLQKELNSLTTKKGGNVEILTSTRVINVEGKDTVESVTLEADGKEWLLKVDGVFISVGREPVSNFLNGLVKLDGNYIVVDDDFQTSCKGVFAGGDCIPKKVRQVVTAVSDGAIIAKNVAKYLQ